MVLFFVPSTRIMILLVIFSIDPSYENDDGNCDSQESKCAFLKIVDEYCGAGNNDFEDVYLKLKQCFDLPPEEYVAIMSEAMEGSNTGKECKGNFEDDCSQIAGMRKNEKDAAYAAGSDKFINTVSDECKKDENGEKCKIYKNFVEECFFPVLCKSSSEGPCEDCKQKK